VREFTAYPYTPSTATARQPHPPRAILPREKPAQHSLYLNSKFILISSLRKIQKLHVCRKLCSRGQSSVLKQKSGPYGRPSVTLYFKVSCTSSSRRSGRRYSPPAW
jgi:hypothetical protein